MPALPPQAAAATTNVVPDASFRRCLNDAMFDSAKPWPITKEQLQAYAGYELGGEPGYMGVECWPGTHGTIASVEGAQYLTRFTGISVYAGKIADLRPLQALTGLRYLSLSGNRRTPFAQLSAFTGLRRLDLDETALADLTPLAGLRNLVSLNVAGNKLTSLTPLRSLTALTSLQLQNYSFCSGGDSACYSRSGKHLWRWHGTNRFADLSPLATLSSLTTLDLAGTGVSTITPLAGLSGLTWLSLSSNRVRDIAPLAGLTRLEYLMLNGNQISDVSPLSRLAGTTYLNLSVNRIADLSPLPYLEEWDGGGCERSVDEPDWGCIAAAYAQDVHVLVGSPGSYPLPVTGSVALAPTMDLVPRSGPAKLDNWDSETMVYSRPGTAVLTFGNLGNDEEEITENTFTGKVTVHVLPATLAPSGRAVFGHTLTVPGIPAVLSNSCQWLRDGTPIAGATSCAHTIADADIGHRISARIAVRNGTAPATKLTTAVTPVAASFAKAPRPTLFGSARVGGTITAKPGTWSPKADSYRFQWLRDGVAIPGATAVTYAPTATDLATSLSVTVTGVKTGYTDLGRNSGDVRVSRGVLSRGKVTVSGTAEFGATLTLDAGTWGPAPVDLTYQWFRGRAAIPGATGRSYTATVADVRAPLTAEVTGSKAGYTTTAATASTPVVQPAALTVPDPPAITGDPVRGSTLTVSTAGWGPAPVTTSCRWYRNGTLQKLATTCSYVLGAADAGRTITARVIGAREGYATVPLASASTVRLGAVTAGLATVTGTAKVGSTLQVATTGWSAEASLTYQWLRDGTAIPGDTGRTHAVLAADRGARLSVTVTGTRDGYASVRVTSTRTAKVVAA